MSDREAPHDERSATLPNALIHRLMAVPAGRSLMTRLAHSPVIPAVSGVDALEGFLDSPTESCLLGGLSVIALQRALTQLIAADIHPLVNLDSLSGLSRDRAGLDWLQAMGVTGLVTTRLSLLQSAPHYGFLAIQTLVLGGASLGLGVSLPGLFTARDRGFEAVNDLGERRQLRPGLRRALSLEFDEHRPIEIVRHTPPI